MVKLDDIRSPEEKVRPRLMRHIYQPSLALPSFSWLHPLASFIVRYRLITLITFTAICVLTIAGLSLIKVLNRAPASSNVTDNTQLIDPHALAIKQTVIKPDTALTVDFTFNLKLVINGQPQAIPATYGQTAGGKTIFNADNSTGDIHVQSPDDIAYTLGDFFLHWGGQFNRQCLLNHCSSEPGILNVTVNDQPNDKYDNYTIQPNDRIVITYGE